MDMYSKIGKFSLFLSILTLPDWCGLMGQDILKGHLPPTLDSSTKFLKERFLFTLFTTVQSLEHIHGTTCFKFCLCLWF